LRFVYLCCFSIIILAAALWLRQPATPSNVTTPTGARSPHEAGHAATVDRIHHSGIPRAASTIRSTTVGTTAESAPGIDGVASATHPAGKSTSSAPTSPSPMEDVDRKPAAELFSMFVDDDPSQVFLSGTVQYHAALKSEAVDPAWAPDAMNAIRDYLTSRYGQRFEIASLDCRTDLCELQLAARQKGDLDTDMRDMQQAVALMKQESWWSALAFDQESTAIGGSPDGRALLLWFCSRK
jgi:hypothetical protein